MLGFLVGGVLVLVWGSYLHVASERLRRRGADRRLQAQVDAVTRTEAERDQARVEARRLALVVEETDSAIVIADSSGCVTWVNPGFTRLTGYTLDEVKGTKPGELLRGPDTDPRIGAELSQAIRERRSVRTEILNYDKLGKKYWIEINLTPVFNERGVLENFIAVETDITVRKSAEIAHEATRRFLRTVVDNVPLPIVVKSGEPETFGQFTLWNRQAEALFGVTAKRALGRTGFEIFPEQLAHAYLRDDERAFASGERLDIPEETIQSKLLGERTVRVVKAPTYGSDGSPEHLLVVLDDITERKKIEADLVLAKDAAESASHAKSAFLAAMSHEIRTPMNAILGLVDLVTDETSASERKELLGTIRESTHALLHIIDDVLDFSKAEAGRLTLEAVGVDLEQLLESVVSTLGPVAARSGVRLLLDFESSAPEFVETDPVRLRQVIFNLASNAIKFSPRELKREREVVVVARSSPGIGPGDVMLTISVCDNGVGMSQQTVSELFQPFVQADRSTTRRFGGTGLGLAIVSEIVKLAGGSIHVSSEIDVGSKFDVCLPVKISRQSRPRRQRDLSGVQVSVCDDGIATRILSRYLEAAGCAVFHTSPEHVSAEQLATREHVVVLPDAMRSRLEPQSRTRPGRILSLAEPESAHSSDILPTISLQPLVRSRLLEAVAVVVGRASPNFRNAADSLPPLEYGTPTIAEAEALGTLVLIAEDNEINRDVIKRQLNRLGYACVVMADGKLAVEEWRKRRFGLLLADCHMPNMDGFELTSMIRSAERGTGGRLPIVAFTANALSGESERCLAAGMDDFLPKPVTLDALRTKIARWLPKPAPRLRLSLDLGHLSGFVGDDRDLHARLLTQFLAQAREIVELIETHFVDDPVRATDQAHKLRSSAAAVGALPLSELCASVELLLKKNDSEAAVGVVEALCEEMRRVEDCVVRAPSPLLSDRGAATPCAE